MGSPFGPKKDVWYMHNALRQAHTAYRHNEVPIGAVLVNEHGDIIARGHNKVERLKSQTAHAEVRAIQQGARVIKDWRFDSCWLFVTLEPCTMCMGLIQLSRFAGVVFGAPSPLFGFRLDKDHADSVYKRDVLIIVEGVLAQESGQLLKQFFKKQRNTCE